MSWEKEKRRKKGGRRKGKGGWARDCKQGWGEREREGEWYRVKALSVSALRYVGTLLNPERLGEKCSTWQ